MRKFFLLSITAKESYDVVTPEYELLTADGAVKFDCSRLWQCQRLREDFFSEVLFRLDRRLPCDYLHSWNIVSPRLLAIFKKYANDGLQVFKVSILDHDGHPALEEFRLFNVIRCLDKTVDLELSTTSFTNFDNGTKSLNIMQWVFRTEQIPLDVHIFRPKERLSTIVISQELAKEIRSAKMTGMAFIKTWSA